MMHGLRNLVCLVGSAAVCAQAAANVPEDGPASDNPYQAIVERNVFGLRPPPPPPDPEEAAKPPPPPLLMTGISTMLGKKLVFLKSSAAPAKPGQPAQPEQYYTLAEGQRDGELEVQQIDEHLGTVKVKYAGTVSTLDFINNGVKERPAPAVAAAGQPGQPGAIPAPPMGMAPGASPTGGQGNPTRLSLPNRPVRLPAPGAGVTTQSGGDSAQLGTLGTGYSGSGNLNVSRSAAAQNQLTAEQQAILIEAERERTRSAVDSGMLPPLPPTPLTQSLQPQPAPVETPVQRPRQIARPGMPLLPQ